MIHYEKHLVKPTRNSYYSAPLYSLSTKPQVILMGHRFKKSDICAKTSSQLARAQSDVS